MKTLVAGASGTTGKQLVEQLLIMGQEVKVIVRPTSNIPDNWNTNKKVSIIRGGIAEMSEEELVGHINDCDAVASCLGHNLNLNGLFGKPRKLVTDAVRMSCKAIQHISPEKPIKFVLMNTTGNRNRDLAEPVSFGQRIIFGIIRLLLPPHPDNEQAADFLRVNIGQNNTFIEWVAVRPDGLIDLDVVSEYEVYPSPIRSAMFNPGKTSRINVGHFMASLIVDQDLWKQWKGQMPVIYNKEV
ncbi:MAG: SDR family oxidoreductase [Bacteroidales bacterium]|nr:SDR family oxidoreductase [Bacteroidales bacterium]